MNYLTKLAKAVLPRDCYHEARWIIRSLPYLGFRVSCPCCGGRFRKFRDGGYTRRSNAECPRCTSMERHRLLWLYLADRTDMFTANLRLLHFAPEPAFLRAFTAMPNVNYVTVDLDPAAAMCATDITRLAFGDAGFDAIICSHVLEHVSDDRQAMSELFRVLKPGGWAIVQSPIEPSLEETCEDPKIVSPEDRRRLFGHAEHVRLYGRDYKARLEEAGFAVTVDGYHRELDPRAREKHGVAMEDVYFCVRPESAAH